MRALDKFLKRCEVNEGRTLIVGSKVHEGTRKEDRRKLFPDAVGVDMDDGFGVDRVLDLEERLPADFGVFEHVECMSVLEHSRRPWLLAANIDRAMANGATILVMVPWVWRIHAYPSDYWRMTPAALESLFPTVTWYEQCYIVENELKDGPPKTGRSDGVRWIARSELIMFGRKCVSTY